MLLFRSCCSSTISSGPNLRAEYLDSVKRTSTLFIGDQMPAQNRVFISYLEDAISDVNVVVP